MREVSEWYGIVIELLGGYFVGVDRKDGRIFLGVEIFRQGIHTGEMVRAGIQVIYWGVRKGEPMKGIWDMKLLAERVRLRVKLQGFSGFRLRAKLAEWIIRLGAWVAWFRVEIDDSPLPPEHPQCQTVISNEIGARCKKIQEGMVKKGGTNDPPITPRPAPPKG